MWETQRLTILLASTACYRDSFIFFLIYLYMLPVNFKHIQQQNNVTVCGVCGCVCVCICISLIPSVILTGNPTRKETGI
jgi:hypothetical protein